MQKSANIKTYNILIIKKVNFCKVFEIKLLQFVYAI